MKKRIPDFSHPKAANLMLVEPERASLVPLFVVLYDWQRNIWSIRTNNSSLVPHRSTHISLYLSLSLSHTQFSTAFFSCFSTRTHDYNTRKQTEEEGGRTWNSQWALWHTASMRVRRAKRSWWWSGFGKPTYKSDEEHKTRGKKIQKQKNEKKVNEQNPSAWHEALRSVRQVYAEQVLSFQHRCSFTPVVHYIVSRTPSFNSDLCIVRLSHFSQPLELIKSRRISLSGL